MRIGDGREPVSRKAAVRGAAAIGRRRATLVIIIIFAVFYVAACIRTQSQQNAFIIAESDSYEASVYRQNCAVCHGKEAFGKMVDGRQVPGLRFGQAAQKTEAEIYEQIKHGKLPMPSFKNQLTEKEIRRMVRFIVEDLQGRKKPPARKG